MDRPRHLELVTQEDVHDRSVAGPVESAPSLEIVASNPTVLLPDFETLASRLTGNTELNERGLSPETIQAMTGVAEALSERDVTAQVILDEISVQIESAPGLRDLLGACDEGDHAVGLAIAAKNWARVILGPSDYIRLFGIRFENNRPRIG